MAKTKLLGSDKQKQLDSQKKAAKKANKRPRKGIGRFFKDIIGKLKKVTWPTWKKLVVTTSAVLAFVLVMAIITGAFDSVLKLGLQWLVS